MAAYSHTKDYETRAYAYSVRIKPGALGVCVPARGSKAPCPEGEEK